MSDKNPFHDNSMWKGASPNIFSKANHLRKNMTEAESVLWEELRNKKMLGFKFRRQHPISIYIADFYCHKLKLIIEVDGKFHDNKEQQKLDLNRSKELEFQGLKIIRFSNNDVLNDLPKVLKKISVKIKEDKS